MRPPPGAANAIPFTLTASVVSQVSPARRRQPGVVISTRPNAARWVHACVTFTVLPATTVCAGEAESVTWTRTSWAPGAAKLVVKLWPEPSSNPSPSASHAYECALNPPLELAVNVTGLPAAGFSSPADTEAVSCGTTSMFRLSCAKWSTASPS